MIRDDVTQLMAEFGLLQSQHTLIDFLLQNISGILILHELPHSRGEQPLIVEVLLSIFIPAVLLQSVFLGLVLVLPGEGGVVQLGVESLLDHLHAFH